MSKTYRLVATFEGGVVYSSRVGKSTLVEKAQDAQKLVDALGVLLSDRNYARKGVGASGVIMWDDMTPHCVNSGADVLAVVNNG